jgi:hypothetical protein
LSDQAVFIVTSSKSKSHYDRQSVGQAVMVSGANLGPATNISFALRFSFRQLLFVNQAASFIALVDSERTRQTSGRSYTSLAVSNNAGPTGFIVSSE